MVMGNTHRKFLLDYFLTFPTPLASLAEELKITVSEVRAVVCIKC
jgi:hypothetical protein